MKPKFVVATAGQFAGQCGRVITSHTYQEIGLHYSVRFPAGSAWIPVGNVRQATDAEIAAPKHPHTFRPAA